MCQRLFMCQICLFSDVTPDQAALAAAQRCPEPTEEMAVVVACSMSAAMTTVSYMLQATR